MEHEDPGAVRTGGITNRPMVGGYRLDVASGTWWWSDEAYLIHGLEPGKVIPTSDLLVARLRSAGAGEAWLDVQPVGTPFSFSRRVVVGTGGARTVLVTGQRATDSVTGAEVVTGHFIDLTGVQADADVGRVLPWTGASAAQRAAIEQAKGLVMVSHQLVEAEAAALLGSRAAVARLPLHDIATRLLDFFQRTPTTRPPSVEAVERFLRSPSALPRRGLRRVPDDTTYYRLVDCDGRELLRPSMSIDLILDVIESSGLPMRNGVEVFVQERRGEEGWRLRPTE